MAWHTAKNFAQTTVDSNALNNTTSPITFAVADGSVFGSTFPMYATVDPSGAAEVIEITARSTNNITATRASAAAHSGTPKIVCAVAAQYISELQTAVDLKAPLDSPALTGTPTAPTASASDNSTKIATTAYVDAAVAGGGGGDFTLITSTAVTSPVGSITFSSIAGTYKGLMLQFTARSSDATSVDSIIMRFNSDTGANYNLAYVQQYGASSLGGGQSTGKTSFADIMPFTGSSASGAGDVSTYSIWMPGYAGTTYHKHILIQALCVFNAGGYGYYWYNNAGYWASTSAITGISLAPNSGGNFAAGCVFSLYGVG